MTAYEPARKTAFIRGDKIKVPKGTEITGTFPEGCRVAQRNAYVINGYRVEEDESKTPTPTVRWAGHRGYWNEARFEDVELIEEGDGFHV